MMAPRRKRRIFQQTRKNACGTCMSLLVDTRPEAIKVPADLHRQRSTLGKRTQIDLVGCRARISLTTRARARTRYLLLALLAEMP
jgi:hypothetical protein